MSKYKMKTQYLLTVWCVFSHRTQLNIFLSICPSKWHSWVTWDKIWCGTESRLVRLVGTSNEYLSFISLPSVEWTWSAQMPSTHSNLIHNWYNCHLPNHYNIIVKGAERNESWHLRVSSEMKRSPELSPKNTHRICLVSD